MSSNPRWLAVLLAATSLPLAAQDGPPQRIDLLAEAEARREISAQECSQAEKDAAAISGEILVCRRRADDEQHRTMSREAARERYARETMYAGDPQAPDVAGPGIFRGNPTIGGLCLPGLQKCPPPPAIMIDVEALPDAPAGSDADRIARGLPALNQNEPPALVPVVSPAESASPEEKP